MADEDTPENKTKAKSRKRYEIPKTATCNVCGDIAAEHLHYGGIACYSCRAFFRRTVNSNRPILECSNDLKCKIDKHTRKRCQYCRFEKCKAAGMKTSWVLTEDDKSKVARRPAASAPDTPEFAAYKPAGEISIKTEAEAEPGLEHSAVKQRRPSSPMSPPTQFKSNNQFYPGAAPGDSHPLYSGLSRQYQTPAYPGLYGAAYNYPGPGGGGGGMAGMFPSYPGSGPAPSLNMNTMHVSLSAPAPGLSLTIETGGGSGSGGGGGLVSPRPVFTKQEADAGSPGSGPAPALAPWHTAVADTKKRPARHHQQSRTIFRCVSGEGGEAARDCDSRSTISSQMSDYSPGPGLAASLDTQMRPNLTFNSRPEFGAFSPNDAHQECNSDEHSGHQMRGSPGEQLKAQVWKLQDVCADNGEAGGGPGAEAEAGAGGSPLAGLNCFTLQETLFVEQLTSIDERVRFQVPMDVSHGKSFLDCAISGSPISQMTIMHAYQTCIKRVVRFANSLQDFVELPPDDMQKLLVSNTVSIINIKISRWLSENTDLKSQMSLLGTNQDLYKEAVDGGRVTEDLNMKVAYSDIFISPWCCDSSHEDRYEALVKEMSMLELDPTTVVLLSVMSLFYISQQAQSAHLSASSSIASHQRKFSLLLQRYLLQSKGRDRTVELYAKYQESLEKLHEMAEILINKRLICW